MPARTSATVIQFIIRSAPREKPHDGYSVSEAPVTCVARICCIHCSFSRPLDMESGSISK